MNLKIAPKNKNQAHSFKINAIFSVIYQVVKIIVPFITAPYISRVLGNENVGAYSYANSILYFFTIIAAFGFTDYGNLAISQVRNDKNKRSQKFYEIMIAKAILTIAAIVVYIPLIFSISDFSTSWLLYITLGIGLLGTLFDTSFMLMGEEEYVSIALRDIFVKLVSTILIFVVVKDNSEMSLITYAGILSGSTVLSALMVLYPCRKYLVKVNHKEIQIGTAFKQGLIFFIPTLVSSVYMNLNKTFIGVFGGGNLENANYEQATKTINFITTALGAINSVVISKVSGIYAQYGYEGIRAKIYDVIHLVFIFALPCFAGIILIAPYFVPLFYGPGYEGTIPLIYVLGLNVLTIPIAWLLLAAYFIPTNKRGKANWVNAIASAIDLLLCIVLIPKLKAIGAGIAYSVAELVQLALFIFVSRKDIEWRKILGSHFIKPFDATLAMSIVLVTLIQFTNFSNAVTLVILISVGMLIYGGCMFLFKEELVLKYASLFWNKICSLLRKGKHK